MLLLNFGLEEAQAASPTAGELLTEALRIWHDGQSQRAGQLLAAAQALLPPGHPLLRVSVPYDLHGRLAAARTRGDAAAFDRGLAEGRDWMIDAAVDAGLASAPRRPKTPAGSSETVD
ncbi:MAG TPA: hypothetical protein VH136_08445 [Trebonia sp.]|nr:hypothetical protein [Trebonia sp.]